MTIRRRLTTSLKRILPKIHPGAGAGAGADAGARAGAGAGAGADADAGAGAGRRRILLMPTSFQKRHYMEGSRQNLRLQYCYGQNYFGKATSTKTTTTISANCFCSPSLFGNVCFFNCCHLLSGKN